MPSIKKVRLDEVTYDIHDGRLPQATSEDDQKVVMVDDKGDYTIKKVAFAELIVAGHSLTISGGGCISGHDLII